MTNQELINKLQKIDKSNLTETYGLSNKNHNLTIESINAFLSCFGEEDRRDDEFFIEDFEDYIQKIADMTTLSEDTQCLKWLAYDISHYNLVNDYIKQQDYDTDYMQDFDIVNEISNTITWNIDKDLYTIIQTITTTK